MVEACRSAKDAWASCISRLASGEAPTQAQVDGLSRSGLVEVFVTLLYDQAKDQLHSLHVRTFWDELLRCKQQQDIQTGLLPALQVLASAVRLQSQQLQSFAQQLLLALVQQLEQQQQMLPGQKTPTAAASIEARCAWQQEQWQQVPASTVALLVGLCDKHHTAVASILMATAPFSLPGELLHYYEQKLQQLCEAIQQQHAEAAEVAAAAAAGDSSDADARSEDAAGMADQSPSVGGSPDITQQAARGTSAVSALPDPYELMGKQWCAAVAGVAACLDELGLAAASEEAYTRVINSHALQQLRTLATQELDQAVLPRCQQLVCAGPLAFLGLVLGQRLDTHIKLQEWQLRLTYLMLETLGMLRSNDMFDIVIDYPDSTPALADLAMCLQHTNMAGQFASTFKTLLQQRLLHAGAATADIIQTYINTIKAMRQLGKSGLLLDVVSEPIRTYLRNRPDTIRCIVSMLTEHNSEAGGGPGSSLLEELEAQQTAGSSGSGFGSSSGGLAGPSGLANVAVPPSSVTALSAKAGGRINYNWCVTESEGDEAALRLLDALQAGSEATDQQVEARQAAGLLGLPVRPGAAAAALLGGSRVDADVVSMLIGIYGGPLLFMDEYRCMLADRLLAKDEYDCEREITTLELLKIRFGDAGLHPCEVMLKDLADSKRLDTNVRALPQQQVQAGHTSQLLPPGPAAALAKLRATICSYLFWPELPEHDLKLPADLQTALEVYAERFRHLKAPRKLQWRPTLGMVELAVTVGNSEPVDFRVTPAHAALLLQFSDDSPAAAAAASPPESRHQQHQQAAGAGVVLSAAQLSAALSVPVPVVRRKAMFWVAAGVLLEQRGQNGELMYSRATSIDPSRIVSREVTDMSWSDDSSSSNSAEDRIIAEMGPFENFIIGLLTNCGTLSVDRLHNMLRVFVVGEPKYEGRTQEQLAAFLQVMVARDRIDVNNGVYSRKKSQS